MQAQQYALPLHPDYYTSAQVIHPSITESYLSHDGGQNFTDGFSTGSSFTYPHQDYRYLLDRGEVASRLCASSLVQNTFDATGLGFAGNPSSSSAFVPPSEDIAAYQQQTWGWIGAPGHGIVAPAPIYPVTSAEPPYFGTKNGENQESIVCSPAAQLPTPAAMAVLLSPSGRSEREPSQSGYSIQTGSATSVEHHANSATTGATRPVQPGVATQGVPDSASREKKHACTMCHKRFDRPSTLRKHLLVHTGEKAFVCDTCGRRFGVASNLNRHVKRCILKPVNTPSPSNKSSSGSPTVAAAESPEASALISSVTSSPMAAQDSSASLPTRTIKRSRAPVSPSSSSSADHSSGSPSSSKSKPPGQKRRRRAPSPSQWVPATLQNFNLLSEDFYSICAPLLPVIYDPPREERNAFGENISPTPYHPCGWNGVLPGPGSGHSGLGGKDVRNYSFGGGRGEYMVGRIQLVC